MVSILSYIAAVSILAPAVIGAIFLNKVVKSIKVLVYFIFISVGVELVTFILFQNGMNNMPLFHLFSYLEFAFIALIFYQVLHNANWQGLIIVSTITFFLFSFINLLFYEGIFAFNSNQRFAELLILMGICGLYLCVLLLKKQPLSILEDPFALLAISLIIYFLGTLYLFLYGTEVLSGEPKNYWIIFAVFRIFLNLMFCRIILVGKMRS